jgi:hypothetical protein
MPTHYWVPKSGEFPSAGTGQKSKAWDRSNTDPLADKPDRWPRRHRTPSDWSKWQSAFARDETRSWLERLVIQGSNPGTGPMNFQGERKGRIFWKSTPSTCPHLLACPHLLSAFALDDAR